MAVSISLAKARPIDHTECKPVQQEKLSTATYELHVDSNEDF
jgi:hypothetical protein